MTPWRRQSLHSRQFAPLRCSFRIGQDRPTGRPLAHTRLRNGFHDGAGFSGYTHAGSRGSLAPTCANYVCVVVVVVVLVLYQRALFSSLRSLRWHISQLYRDVRAI